jgi:hypothetical protein
MDRFTSDNNDNDGLTAPLLSKETEFNAADCDYKCLQIIVSKNESVTLNHVLKDPAINKPTPIEYVGLLRTAVEKEAIKCMDILLKVPGIDVNFTDSHYKLPILWLAAFNGKVNAVKKLLESTTIPTINVHKGPPPSTSTQVDNDSVTIDVGGQSPIVAATIELNTLRNKSGSEEKQNNYKTIIPLLKMAGATYPFPDEEATKIKRKIIPRAGKSRRRKKKRQSKKTKAGRTRKQKNKKLFL